MADIFDQLAQNASSQPSSVTKAPAPVGGTPSGAPSGDIFDQVAAGTAKNPWDSPVSTQPSFGSKVWQGAQGSMLGQAVKAVPEIVMPSPPKDHKEELALMFGGAPALNVYRAAKHVVGGLEDTLKSPGANYQQAKQDFLRGVADAQGKDYRNLASDSASLASDTMTMAGSPLGPRFRELSEGARPGGNLATPVTKDALDAGTLYLLENNPFPRAAKASAGGTSVEQVAARGAAKAPIAAGAPAVDEAPTVSSVQPSLHQSIRDFVNTTAKSNGLTPIPDTVPVTDAPQQLADAFETRSHATFDTIEQITGIDPTALKGQMAARADQITEAAAAGDLEKAGGLEQLQKADEARMNTAFAQAKTQGVDVDQARSDWNSSLRADELSTAIRNSKSGASTLQSPELDPSKLAPRLQKLAESQPGGKTPKLFQLGGEGQGTNLVESAEQARGAIKDFEPTTSTGRQALQEILQKNTGTGWTQTAKQSFGFKPQTDYIGAFRDFNKMSSADVNAQFGADAPAVRSFLQKQAAWQVGKMLATGAGLGVIAKATGALPWLLHLVMGGE